MADNVTITAGTGTTIRTLVDGSAVEWPVGVACYATTVAAGANVLAVVTPSAGLPVAQQGTWTVTANAGTGTLAVSAASLPLPAGASTSAKQPALGTAGTASADVLTVQGIASMTALKVDGSAVTQPISGSVTSTAAGNVASGATDSGNPVKVGGVYNTSQPTLTTGQRGDLQLDANGNVRVAIASGGGTGGTASTFGAAFPSTGTAIGAKDSTGANLAALNLDASGFLKVNVAAGGGSGGTSSSFAAAVPATGTAAGYSDGTNLQLARVYDTDSGAGTQYTAGVVLRGSASGGSVELATSANPLRTDPTGTTTQPVSAASLPLPTGAATEATLATLSLAQGSTSSGQKGGLTLAAVTTGSPTYTTAQTSPLSLDTAGNLRVLATPTGTTTVSGTVAATQSGTWNVTNVSGTVSLPTGAATEATLATLPLAQASTTSGQKGPLAQGAVTTGAPTYTTGQTDPLSLTTAGALRVDASATTQPVSAASLPLPAGASTSAKQPALGTAGSASADVLTIQGVASMTAVKVDGSAVTQPVSGTVTANIGTSGSLALDATLTGGSQKAIPVAAATGGASMTHLISAASTNATSVKASAGTVYGLQVFNTNAAARYLKLYDLATAPTVGSSTVVKTILVPGGSAGAGVVIPFPVGLAFAAGIALATTTAAADADTGAVGAGDLVIDVDFK